jgi:hypothetical protein
MPRATFEEPRVGCSFCGSEELTSIDLFPQWVRAIHPTPNNTSTISLGLQSSKSRRYETRPTGMRVKQLCAACKNGWISRLDVAASEILKPILDGDRVELQLANRTVVSAWMTKTAMLREFLDPPQLTVYLQSERSYLRESQQPPPGTYIWSAHRQSAPRKMLLWTRHTSYGFPVDQGRVSVQVTTLLLGHSVTYVVSDRLGRWRERVIRRCMDRPGKTVPLWPFNRRWFRTPSITWPPEIALDSDGINELSRCLFERGEIHPLLHKGSALEGGTE